MDAGLDDVFVDEISFPATDGYALTGTLFLPRGAKRQIDAKAIGHFGFFRPKHRDTLWRSVAERIQGE